MLLVAMSSISLVSSLLSPNRICLYSADAYDGILLTNSFPTIISEQSKLPVMTRFEYPSKCSD